MWGVEIFVGEFLQKPEVRTWVFCGAGQLACAAVESLMVTVVKAVAKGGQDCVDGRLSCPLAVHEPRALCDRDRGVLLLRNRVRSGQRLPRLPRSQAARRFHTRMPRPWAFAGASCLFADDALT